MSETTTLKPCPFCGGKAFLIVCDGEGNIRDESYEDDPWSGLSYAIEHTNENNKECPIATHEDETIGSLLYGNREEAALYWNDRQYC